MKLRFRDRGAPRSGWRHAVIPFNIAACRSAVNSPTVSFTTGSPCRSRRSGRSRGARQDGYRPAASPEGQVPGMTAPGRSTTGSGALRPRPPRSSEHRPRPCPRDLPAGRLDDPAEGWPGDPHPFGGLLLVQPLVIGQPEGLEFVHGQDDLDQLSSGHSGRLEHGVPLGRSAIRRACFGRADTSSTPSLLDFERMLV